MANKINNYNINKNVGNLGVRVSRFENYTRVQVELRFRPSKLFIISEKISMLGMMQSIKKTQRK